MACARGISLCVGVFPEPDLAAYPTAIIFDRSSPVSEEKPEVDMEQLRIATRRVFAFKADPSSAAKESSPGYSVSPSSEQGEDESESAESPESDAR